jgi:hypothetical protein
MSLCKRVLRPDRKWNLVAIILALGLVGLMGCGGGGSSSGDGGGDTRLGSLAIVNTKADDEANIAIIDFVSGETYPDLLSVGGSCDMTQYGDEVYIVDKSNDRIVKFDPVSRSLVSEMSLPSGCGPNSIVFASATKAYVTASDEPAIYIVNPETMTVSGSIDIATMADDDGDPDQYQAMIKEDDGRLYVTLRRSSGRSLSDHSSLAVIDTATDTVIEELVLRTNGVSGMAQDALGGQTGGEDTCSGDIYVHVGGSMTKADDGAIEKVDAVGLTSTVLAQESAYGGTITTWVFDSNTTGWAIAGLSTDRGGEGYGLLRFDLEGGTFTPVSAFQNQIYTYALDYTDDGLLLVGDKDENTYGVRVYDSEDGYAERFAEPLNVGLIPNRILVLR